MDKFPWPETEGPVYECEACQCEVVWIQRPDKSVIPLDVASKATDAEGLYAFSHLEFCDSASSEAATVPGVAVRIRRHNAALR